MTQEDCAVPFTLRNIKQDLEDIGPRFDGPPDLEFRAATKALELEKAALSYQRVPPGYRFPYGHTHETQEEVYVDQRQPRSKGGRKMGPVEVEISTSVDGYITGPNEQSAGLGEGGEILHAWFFQDPDRERLADDALFATSGAVITSRKIYDGTEGWGETGFYQMPVFVLTHRPHDVVVKGETTFTFVTDGIESAIAQAKAAAGEKKVHIMGGASVIQQALNAGLVDSIHLHVAPVVLGAGTRLFENLTKPIELERTEVVESQFATHLRFRVVK
jgi:dihydrofolate reductase